jgi:hypothetical protein
MQQARLNIFQKLMLRWETLAPYNGVQAMLIGHPADIPSETLAANAANAWLRTLQDFRIGTLTVAGRHYTIAPPDAPTPVTSGSDVAAISADVAAISADVAGISAAELNHAFAPGECPLRAILCPDPAGLWLIIAYRHFVADSVAVRTVMRRWHEHIRGQPPPFTPPAIGGPGYWSALGPRPARWSLSRAALDILTQIPTFKRVRRVEHRAGSGVKFSSARLSESALPRIVEFGQRHNAKVTDVVRAALAVAITPEGFLQRTSRRRDLAIGSIVDLRPSSPVNLDNVFGMYLGFTTAVVPESAGSDLPALVRLLGADATNARERNLAAAGQLRIALGLAAHRALGSRVRNFYRKRIPVSAGLSNVILRDPWPADSPDIRDYVRASPTGPMMPIALSLTTLRNSLHLGLTWRTPTVPDASAGRILERLISTLENPGA